ncbi:MAG TPA: high frequency lysogenization protein HflD [Xanthomonadales bacterium]|nr:high frequency lysogenization protein HflD [Xanthomonadales bacterium]
MSDNRKDRTLALAGVLQATELVRQAAWHGTWSGYAASASLESLFRLEADTVDTIYGDRKRMRLGLETLISVLQGDQANNDALRYAIALLQIERRFQGNRKLQEKIGQGLEEIEQSARAVAAESAEDYKAEKVAELYTATISQIQPRIVVNGRPQYLKVDRVVHWVRSLLLSGLRSAVLWDQLGGGRLELMFGRRKILDQAQELLHS